jgi:transcription elongation factor Elf1
MKVQQVTEEKQKRTKTVKCSWCGEEFRVELDKDFNCPKCNTPYINRESK